MNDLTVKSDYGLSAEDTLRNSIEQFLKAQDVKPSSKNTYRRALRQFIAWITQNGISNPTREDILAYKAYMVESGISSYTLSSYLVAVRKYFEWAEGMKIYPNIARGVKDAKQPKTFSKDALTVDQARELLTEIDRSTLQGKRDFAILNLLLRTGLRTIEVIRANIGDIRQKGGEAILYVQGKGRDAKDQIVLLTEVTLKPIHEYLQSREYSEDSEPLFVSLSDRNRNQRLTTRTISSTVKGYLKQIGLDNSRLTAHSLRHTAITLSLLGGSSIQEAQALGRHASIDTTLVYAHNLNRTGESAPERKIDAVLAAG